MSRRMITSETWEDEFFTGLSMFNRLLWIGLITAAADDQGRTQDSAALLRSKIFPLDDVSLADIEAALSMFCKAHKIERYTVNGKKCIQIIAWWKHQTPRWAGRSILPPPPGWVDRERYHGAENKLITSNWDSVGGYIADYTTNDVKDDVNDEDDVKDDIESGGASSPFDAILRTLEAQTGIPAAGKPSVDAINLILANQCEVQDVIAGCAWLKEQGTPIRFYSTVVGPANTARLKRVQGTKNGNGHKPGEGQGRWLEDAGTGEKVWFPD